MTRVWLGPAWMIAATLFACGPNVSTDGSEDDGGDDDSSSGDPTTTTATTATTMTTDATMTAATMTTATTVTDDTGTPVTCEDSFVIGCQSYCAALITCHPDEGTYEECVTSCQTDLAEEEPVCQLAQCEAFACAGTLDCASLDNDALGCEDTFAKAEEACGGDEVCGIGEGPGNTCEFSCSGPPEQTMRCQPDGCECYEDGELVAECALMEPCTDIGVIDQIALECCGW
jgi:hypothetical protein